MTPPDPRHYVYFIDALSGGNYAYWFKVIDNGSNAVRKEPHKRELTVEYLTCIEGGGYPPAS